VILPPIIGKILDNSAAISGQTPSITNYSLALTTIPVGLAIAGVLSMLLRESYSKQA
jgi:hypothetical protein